MSRLTVCFIRQALYFLLMSGATLETSNNFDFVGDQRLIYIAD